MPGRNKMPLALMVLLGIALEGCTDRADVTPAQIRRRIRHAAGGEMPEWEKADRADVTPAQIRRRMRHAAGGEMPEWEKAIEQALDRSVSFEFHEEPRFEVVKSLQVMTRTNVILDPRVAEDHGGPAITLKMSDVRFRVALGRIMKLSGMDFIITNQAILISTPEAIIANVQLRIYDVRDLVVWEEDGHPWFARAHAAREVPRGEDARQEGLSDSELVEMVRARVRPREWSEGLGISIVGRHGRLVVMQRPYVHLEIERFLESLRQQGVPEQEE